MQGALDMMEGGLNGGRSGLTRRGFHWFIAASLLAHLLALLALYKVEPGGYSRVPETAPVMVRLFEPPAHLPTPAEPPLVHAPPVAPISAKLKPDVIDTPDAGVSTNTPPAAPPTALPDDALRQPGSPAIVRRPAIEKLFDKGVIAERAMGPAVSEHPGSGITFDTKEMMLAGYMGLLRDKVEGIWVYPRKAAEEGIYGDLIIRFAIGRDGRLASVKVLRTSGYALLDEAALKALRDAGPYWPLPEAYRDETLVVTGRFIYSLYGAHIR